MTDYVVTVATNSALKTQATIIRTDYVVYAESADAAVTICKTDFPDAIAVTCRGEYWDIFDIDT